FTLTARAGQTVSLNVLLKKATYKVRFRAGTIDGSPLPALAYSLGARTLTDPLDPVPADPNDPTLPPTPPVPPPSDPNPRRRRPPPPPARSSSAPTRRPRRRRRTRPGTRGCRPRRRAADAAAARSEDTSPTRQGGRPRWRVGLVSQSRACALRIRDAGRT